MRATLWNANMTEWIKISVYRGTAHVHTDCEWVRLAMKPYSNQKRSITSVHNQ